MIHLGDITKINGAEIEPVWCITGGSPCQDLSIAGKRAGLAGVRSGLFMEQVRIVKEMRAEDKRNGRTGNMVRPRYLVWENVVGASAATEEKTSTPCWKKLRVSQNQDFLYLDCRKSGNGQKQEPLTVMGGLSLGELTTLRTGEKPSETAVQEMLSVWGPHSVAEESRLSQILEVDPLPKYNLTAKACLGILRRAERRGKDLPEQLKAVLLMQSASGGAVTEEEKAR